MTRSDRVATLEEATASEKLGRWKVWAKLEEVD